MQKSLDFLRYSLINKDKKEQYQTITDNAAA